MNEYNGDQKENLDLSHTFDEVIKQKAATKGGVKRYSEVIKKKKKNSLLIIVIIISWILAGLFFYIKKANTPEEKYIISPDQYIKKFLRD